MRRDYVTLDVSNVGQDGTDRPTVFLEFDGPDELLAERLEDVDGEPLGADQIDVAYRLKTPIDADDATGVFSLTNRVTGDFVLEVNADADDVLGLVRTARDDDHSDDGHYRVEVTREGETEATYDKQTLLVYDDEGSLLRQHSLIPSGVEL